MKISNRALAIAGGGSLAFSVLIGFLGFDQILKFGIRDQTALKKRNELRKIYLKLPFPLDFRVYFFNVTNANQVVNGAKPILQEIGPYVYEEFKEKIDVVDNEAEDSLTYTQYDTFKFSKEKSGKLDENDYVTILHPLIVGIVNTVARDSPQLLTIINKALGPLFNNPKSVFLTIKVKELLFEGIIINCNVKDFSAKAVCTQLKQQLGDLVKPGPERGSLLFSLLGPRNATLGPRIKVHRGVKNSHDVGRLMEFNGQKQTEFWGTEVCNRFHGTDGWIFPPNLKKEEGIWSYSSDLCRSIGLNYVEDTTYKGVNCRKHVATLGDQDHNQEDKCYCSKICMKKGVFDLSNCMGAPIYATLPHFLEADETFLKQVDGLNPVEEKHIIRISFEYMTGTPLEAKKRMQFNLPIQPQSKIDLMKNLPVALHPMFWVEESLDLDGDLFNLVAMLFTFIKVMEGGKWITLLTGGGLLGFAGFRHYKNKKEIAITPVKSAKDTSENKGLTEKKELNVLGGVVNHAMSGNEFDRY